MTKSVAAFRHNAENLFEKGFRVYFWTFTFREVQADWDASRQFSRLLNHLQKAFTECRWGGVRVAELHREHGVHYHALINRRLAVDIVRRIASGYGFGRIEVKVADVGAARYLSKYLSKQKDGPLTETGRRARRWSVFGHVHKTRVSDLVNDSPMWIFRREHNLPFIDYRFEPMLYHCWCQGEEVFKTAWFAARRGEIGVVFGLTHGHLVADGCGGIVERVRFSVQPF